MKRFQSVSNVQLNTIGRAALLEFRYTDGSSDAIEIECDRVGELIGALFKTCAMLGHRKGTAAALGETSPEDTIAIPTLEMAVRGNGNGGAWLLFRVGAHDFGVLFPERQSRRVLARLLESPKQAALDSAREPSESGTQKEGLA